MNTIDRQKTQPLGLPMQCFFVWNSIIFLIKHNLLGYRLVVQWYQLKMPIFLLIWEMQQVHRFFIYKLVFIQQVFNQTYNKELQREVILIGLFYE